LCAGREGGGLASAGPRRKYLNRSIFNLFGKERERGRAEKVRGS